MAGGSGGTPEKGNVVTAHYSGESRSRVTNGTSVQSGGR